MSISSTRLELVTNQLIKQYLQNGTLPDEAQVAAQLIAMFPTYYDSTTNTFDINVPLWKPTNLTYRQTSDVQQWNTTQQSAAQDMTVAYTDLLEDVSSMTNTLYDYVNRANLIKNRISNLQSRIQNLLLISTSTDGFIYSWFDNFIDTTKTNFLAPYHTTALVNTASQNVELPVGPVTAPGLVTSSIVNLAFIQDSDIRFSILNPVQSQQSLSSATLSSIFTNQAVAWQQNITLTGPGPLVCNLTANISPVGTVLINKIEMYTKMTNYSNELLVQLYTSIDGVNYTAVNSPANPQYIGEVGEWNFPPIEVKYIQFLVTKNTADQNSTYNIGFQYINFQQITYSLEADFYSIPIYMNGIELIGQALPINKIAIETCAVEPTDTNINYFIIPQNIIGAVPIPISPDTEANPLYPTIVNLGALTNVIQNVATSVIPSASPTIWHSGGLNGSLYTSASGLAGDATLPVSESIIPNTITMYRNFGPVLGSGAANGFGWQSNPSGYPAGYFKTFVQVNNPDGILFDAQGNSAFIDNALTTGAVTLQQGLHSIATQDYPLFQSIVQSNSDLYFAWISRFVSTFDFFNNVTPGDQSVFTYDSTTGNIYCYPTVAQNTNPGVDFSNSFVPSAAGDGTYRSSSLPITPFAATSTAVNAGTEFNVTVNPSGIPQWINEIQGTFNIPTGSNITITVNTSVDNINWTTQLSNIPGPTAGISSGSVKFNSPVYCEYLQIIIGNGNTTSISAIQLFAPIFLTAGKIQTLPFELPTSSSWLHLVDNLELNNAQTYEIYNNFADPPAPIFNGGYTSPTSWFANISTMPNPNIYIYMQVSSNNSYDPYIYNVQANSQPVAHELSQIAFSYNKVGASNIVGSVIFQAHLSSTQAGITPQLQSYRVKMV